MDRMTFYDNMEKFWRVVDDAEVRDGLPTKGEYVEQSVIDRLAAYEDAEEQGRLIVLPCKMGDTVWHVYSDGMIVESRVSMLQQKADKTWKVRLSDYWGVHDVNINEIGKTIFPTREAAEAALGGDAT